MFLKRKQVKYKIMSFDGGGIRAIIPATILHRLTLRFPELIDNTDLFAGTSTGSIIGLALASGKSTSEIVDLFSLENARQVFATPHNPPIKRPKYSNRNLINLLATIFPSDLRLKDLRHRVVIPAFRVVGPHGEAWSPVFFNNFPDSPTRAERVIDVAAASNAAPVYFPSYNNYIDGGLIANNPGTAAISFAIKKRAGGQTINNVVLFSFGTGYSPHKITKNTAKWGFLQWINPLPCAESQPADPLLAIAMEGTAEADAFFTASSLEKRFFRLNPELQEDVSIDDYEKIPQLLNIAESADLEASSGFCGHFWFGRESP